jgi:hypothetical protein
MRSSLDQQSHGVSGGRLRLLAVLLSVTAVVATVVTADTAYHAASSAVPGLALATVATALSYGPGRLRARLGEGERIAPTIAVWTRRGAPQPQLVNDGPSAPHQASRPRFRSALQRGH